MATLIYNGLNNHFQTLAADTFINLAPAIIRNPFLLVGVSTGLTLIPREVLRPD